MKRRYIVIFLLFFLISCTERGHYNLMEISQDTIMYNRIDKVHDLEEVLDFLKSESNMYDIFEKLDIKYYKALNGMYYTVIKTDTNLCLLSFNNEKIYNSTSYVVFSSLKSKRSIEKLNVGDTLNDVLKSDPTGQYNFLLKSWDGVPHISCHYFEDGECFSIVYEDDIIVSIQKFTI